MTDYRTYKRGYYTYKRGDGTLFTAILSFIIGIFVGFILYKKMIIGDNANIYRIKSSTQVEVSQ
jgi:hypothetical protein